MRPRIALATVSGRAYYKLVNQLQRKGLPFLSLRPWDPVPLGIKVVVTTNEERHLIDHPNVLVLENGSDSASVVDAALLRVRGKQNYEKVVVGVDPGKTCGVAILGDASILATRGCSSLEETAKVIVEGLKRFPAAVTVVKIGDGAPAYARELTLLLDEVLPGKTVIEIVSEVGTSRFVNETTHRRGLRDAMSALEIVGRKGKTFSRGNSR
ncbi:MAG: hypothetical protein JSW19_03355 [Candidatus Bathyarchaeota archaeon]|nr:MAG: hypothetical protein JSW19_03355 [Candidatus Bathyarchaeota archaeon]